jgi:hypothetical protein
VELSRVVEDHVVVFRQHYFEKFGKRKNQPPLPRLQAQRAGGVACFSI